MNRLLRLALFGLIAALGGCAGQQATSPAALDSTQVNPAQVAALPTPEGINAAVWHELTAALSQQLVAQRQSSAATPTQLPRPSQVMLDKSTHELSWGYELPGDYDQDGVVTLADLVPLAQHFRVRSSDNPSPECSVFGYWTMESVIDGDRNGEINLSDLTVLGKNLGNRIDNYELYGSTKFADYPMAELTQTYPVEITDFTGVDAGDYEKQCMTAAGPAPGHGAPWIQAVPAVLGLFSADTRRAGRLKLRLMPDGYDSAWQAIWLRTERAGLASAPSLPAGHPMPEYAFGSPEDYVLEYSPSTSRLTWFETFWGNLDFNQEVNIADLNVYIRRHFEHGPWAQTDGDFSRDADGNGVITMHDIGAIDKFYEQYLQGYVIYGSDVPMQNPTAQDGVELLQVDLNAGTTVVQDGRPYFSVDLSGITQKYVWVVPLTGHDMPVTGHPSAVITRTDVP